MNKRVIQTSIILLVIVSGVAIDYHMAQTSKPIEVTPVAITDKHKNSTVNPYVPATPTAVSQGAATTTKAPSNNTKSCTTKALYPKTVYESDPGLASGKTTTLPGYNGEEYDCPGKAPIVSAPIDTIVHQGTYVVPDPNAAAEAAQASATAQQAAQDATNSQIAQQHQAAISSCSRFNGSSAYDQCMEAYGF